MGSSKQRLGAQSQTSSRTTNKQTNSCDTSFCLEVEIATNDISFDFHLSAGGDRCWLRLLLTSFCRQVEFRGTGGSLGDRRDQWPLAVYRDDAPEDPYNNKG